MVQMSKWNDGNKLWRMSSGTKGTRLWRMSSDRPIQKSKRARYTDVWRIPAQIFHEGKRGSFYVSTRNALPMRLILMHALHVDK